MPKRQDPVRKHIGSVSVYDHHGAWWLYYRENSRSVRRCVGSSEALAEYEASLLNARLVAHHAGLTNKLLELARLGGGISADATPGLPVAELRQRFLHHHEHVLSSSLATVHRYAAATAHLVNFAAKAGLINAAGVSVPEFVEYLRTISITPTVSMAKPSIWPASAPW